MASIAPLPSLIRAASKDAANARMQRANRTKWTAGDYNLAATTMDRLVRSCFSLPADHNDPDCCFVRFSVAEQMEWDGRLSAKSNVLAEVNAVMGA